ncbi:MAG TPA: hypothetical protein VHL52_03435 [Acidimicrobiia bacterium]|nr:hypothetical protein [Acidimicrobiia bacterium]
MALIYEWGFFIRPAALEDLQAWLVTNEPELARAAPEGLEYLGTYAPVWASEPRCDLYQVWRWRRANEFNFRAAARADRSDFARLAGEFLSFVDEARTEEETFRLHRSLAETPVEAANRTEG